MKEAGRKSFEPSPKNITDLSIEKDRGAELRALRKEAGLSQKDLGAIFSVRQDRISELELNKINTEEGKHLRDKIERYIQEKGITLPVERKERSISEEMGARYRAFRTVLGLNTEQASSVVGIDSRSIYRFEAGKNITPQSLEKLVSSFEPILDGCDTSVSSSEKKSTSVEEIKIQPPEVLFAQLQMKLRRFTFENEATGEYEGKDLLNIREERKWMKTINNLPTHKAVKALRLSEGLNQREFAKASEVHNVTLRQTELAIKRPFADTLNKIIDASILDPTSKPAQLLRLKIVDRELLNEDRLRSNPFGELMSYKRVALGATQEEVGEALHVSESLIVKIENSPSPPSLDIAERYREWLDINFETNTANLIRFKVENSDREVPDDILTAAIAEGYILLETDIPNATNLSLEERELLNAVTAHPTLGAKFRYLREQEAGLSPKELASKIPGKRRFLHSNIAEVELDYNIPDSHNIALMLRGLRKEYDIHHPITWHILDTAEKERKAREHRGKQIFPYPDLGKFS